MTHYVAVWYNEHATGTLPVRFDSPDMAYDYAFGWLLDMQTNDPDGAPEYGFDIVEASPEDDPDVLDHQIEGTLSHFDRYIG